MDAFEWSDAIDSAAKDIADGRLTLNEIAEKAQVDRKTLWNWRQHPEFAARVEEHLQAFRDEVRRRGISVREKRVKSLDDHWNLLHRIVAERAADPKMADVPGGTTGLIVHNVKGVGKGDDFQLIDLYEVDTGTLKEMREHARQAAQELGQWTEKQEISGDAEKPVVVMVLRGVSMSEL